MEIGEIVDQLIEKKLRDFVDSELEAGKWREDSIQKAIAEIISERLQARMDAMKPELVKKAAEYLDTCEIVAKFGGYRGIEVSVKAPEHPQEL